MITQPITLPGEFTMATLPPASSYTRNIAWVTDRPGGAGPMISNGTIWQYFISGRRFSFFNGVTGSDGTFSGSFGSVPYTSIEHVSVERFPPTTPAITVRLASLDLNGFSVIAEQRSSLTVLSLQVLSFAVTPVVGQQVSAMVVGL